MARVQDVTFEKLQDLYSDSKSSSIKTDQHKSDQYSHGSGMGHELFAIKSGTTTPPVEIYDEEMESTTNTGSTAKAMQTANINASQLQFEE